MEPETPESDEERETIAELVAGMEQRTAKEKPVERIRNMHGHAKLMREQAAKYGRTAVAAAVCCGKLLIAQKKESGHGKWGAWLKTNFPASHKTANQYMRMAMNAKQIELAGSIRQADDIISSVDQEARWLRTQERCGAERRKALHENPHLASEFLAATKEYIRWLQDAQALVGGPAFPEERHAFIANRFQRIAVLQSELVQAIVKGWEPPRETRRVMDEMPDGSIELVGYEEVAA